MLLENGAKPKEIQSRLGHSRLATTMDKYVHVTRKMKTEAVYIFAQQLKKSTERQKNCRPFKIMGDNRRMFLKIHKEKTIVFKNPLLFLRFVLVHFQNGHEGFLRNFY